ncbi:MAG: hypothetical protein J5842_01305, partial [Lachnospiraceae bacterium]|nr:hypothetical protein [Lachnospiraceae bacterium]
AWIVSYPIAAAYAKISGKSKFKKGFNIKIPRPMSPLGWYNYYRNEQGHATGQVKKVQDNDGGFFAQAGTFIGRSIQYNLWDPFKSIVTLDINSLAGGGVIEPHAKEKEIDKQQRIDAEMRSIRENIGDNED